jgi:two-component system nitrate/nitrite response regulator NarL
MTLSAPLALVVSGDPYIRAGIRAQLAGEAMLSSAESPADLEVVGEAEPEGWDLAASDVGAEVVFWDGAGPEVDRGAEGPLLISLVEDEEDARRALASGSTAVVLRGSERERLVAAAIAAKHGLVAVDDAFVELLPGAMGPGELPSGESFTPREEEVIELMAQGLSNREIAEALEVSVHTAKFHVNAILNKLGAQTRTEAVVLAARLGLLKL